MSSSSNTVKFVDEYELKLEESIDSPLPYRLTSPPKVIRVTAFVKKSDFMLPKSLEAKFDEL